MLISANAESSSVQVSKQLLFVNPTASANLLQFDVPTMYMGIEGRFAAPKQLAGFLDRDEVVAGLVRNLLVNGRLDGRRDNRLEDVSKEFGNGRFEFHVS